MGGVFGSWFFSCFVIALQICRSESSCEMSNPKSDQGLCRRKSWTMLEGINECKGRGAIFGCMEVINTGIDRSSLRKKLSNICTMIGDL